MVVELLEKSSFLGLPREFMKSHLRYDDLSYGVFTTNVSEEIFMNTSAAGAAIPLLVRIGQGR